MPIEKVPGGFHVKNTTTKKPLTKKKALKQLAAIEISKHGKNIQKDYQQFLETLLENHSNVIKKVSVIFSENASGKASKNVERVIMKNKEVAEVLDKSFHPLKNIVETCYKLSEKLLKKVLRKPDEKKDIVFKIVVGLGEEKGNICYSYFFNGKEFEMYPDVEHFLDNIERGVVISRKDLKGFFGG